MKRRRVIICDKNVSTSNNGRLYLATLEFVSGEYIIFNKAFYAEDESDLEQKIHNCS